jgi:lysozyme
MGRKRAIAIRWRVAALALLAAFGVIGWQWWVFIHWTPPRGAFPVQGVLIGARDRSSTGGAVDFASLKAVGADFVYLEASVGAKGRDPAFGPNLAAARAAAVPVGVVHHYDPCVRADRQAANFVTIVPRDADLLPPAIELDETADACEPRVSEAEVESELTTFLNQVEGHVGKPAILKLSRDFEDRYGIASKVERNLWLTRDRFQPDYGGRPWTLWTANAYLRSPATEGALRWVAAQP